MSNRCEHDTKHFLLRQTLPYPVNGNWSGGAKQVFDWRIDWFGFPKTDSKGQYIRIGSWSANHWFCVAFGKSEKLILRNAKFHLRGTELGKQSKFEYIEVD